MSELAILFSVSLLEAGSALYALPEYQRKAVFEQTYKAVIRNRQPARVDEEDRPEL